jgi:hypothetical protein
VYILPALPLFCLALGPWLGRVVAQPGARRLAFAMAALLTLLVTVAGAMVVFGHPGLEARHDEAPGLAGGADALGRVLLAIGAWGIAMLLLFGMRRGVAALLGTLVGLWLLIGLAAQPLLNDASSARGVMRRAAAHLRPTDELALVAWKEQNLLMADRPARTFGFTRDATAQFADALAWQRVAPAQRWLMLEDDALPRCVDRRSAVFVGRSNRREWWLLPSVASAACTAAPAR